MQLTHGYLFKRLFWGWVWWHKPIIPALRRLRIMKFEMRLGYTVRSDCVRRRRRRRRRKREEEGGGGGGGGGREKKKEEEEEE
jgi:hypothetical protein